MADSPLLAPFSINVTAPIFSSTPFEAPLSATAPIASSDDLAWSIADQVIGWVYFACWSVSFYPQVWTNFREKSVAGFSIDYQFLNIQYMEVMGAKEGPSTPADVAFGIHGLALCIVLAIQSFIYPRGDQKVNKLVYVYTAIIWTAIVVVGALVGFKVLLLLWLIQAFGFVKMSITLVKYTPQVYLNWRRKSTSGFSLPGVLLDVSGGVLSFAQMFIMSFHSGNWAQFQGGNIPKFGLSVLTIVFDIIFVVQDYMYRARPGKTGANGYEPLYDEPTINATEYPLDGGSSRGSYHVRK